MIFVRRIVLAILWVLATATNVAAQQRGGRPMPHRIPVTVILLDTLPHDPAGTYLIQRRPGSTPQDVILLRTTATAVDLADAVRLVLTTRAAGGGVPTRPMTLRARSRTAGVVRAAVPSWVRRVVDDLRRTQPREVAGHGRVQAVEVWLPRQGERVVPL